MPSEELATPAAFTVGVIAKRFNVPVHAVQYIVDTRRIKPAFKAGVANIFSEADAAFIGHELNRIAKAKEGRGDE